MPPVSHNRPAFMKAALTAAGAAGVAAGAIAVDPPAAAAAQAPARQAAEYVAPLTPACPEPTAGPQQRRPTQCGPGLPPCPNN
jgi:hypothetical protein